MTDPKSTRMTKQRQVILNELRKVTSHPTADNIYDMVRARMPHISLGTVYRNLELLARQGDIQKLSIDGDRVHYDGDVSEHYHIRCVKCGRVDDYPVEANISTKELNQGCGYEVAGFKLEFSGVCPKCKKKSLS